MKCAPTETDEPDSFAREILSRLGDRWSVLTIHMIDGGSIRFTDLKRRIARVRPISPRVLTRTLRQLERDGLISRNVVAAVPPRVDYSLTGLGERFLNFASEILDWTVESRADVEVARASFEASPAVPLAAQPIERGR